MHKRYVITKHFVLSLGHCLEKSILPKTIWCPDYYYLMCSEGVAVHIQRGLGLPSQASLIDHHGNMLPGVQLKQSITVEHSLLHLWRGGRMRCKRWRGRGVEGWRGGGVEEWRGGGVEEWRDGGMRCKK